MCHRNISFDDYLGEKRASHDYFQSCIQIGVVAEEKREKFDERYHSSYASKVKAIPLERIETAIAKAIGDLTHWLEPLL